VASTRISTTSTGNGAAPGTSPETCPQCHGSGSIAVDQGPFSFSQVCPTCGGRGTIISSPCKHCRGTGVEVRPRDVKVKIPPGVDTGTRVQLSGQGEVGPGGGQPGDLYVEVHVAPHRIFQRDGVDLRCSVSVPMTAAALGTSIELPLLEADLDTEDIELERSIDLEITPGTQSGSEKVLRGRGVPGLRTGARGDVIVTVEVETPTRLDERQEELLRELAALRHEESPDGRIQPTHKGMFGRLRDAFNPR